MDEFKFRQACEKIINMERAKNGIGTLGEKTLHAVLKQYFEPYEANHETKIGGFVADIVGEDGIIEIQTRGFDKLRRKLEVFLSVASVTIVYPIAKTKWLSWIDIETGEITAKRKSPKIGKPFEIFFELYKIKSFLTHPNLKFCIVLLDMEESRYLNGFSKNKKRGSSRSDRIPVEIRDEIYIESLADYIKLIPDTLPEQFDSKDYHKATGLTLSRAQTALNVLFHIGAVERTGKQGNLYLYERS